MLSVEKMLSSRAKRGTFRDADQRSLASARIRSARLGMTQVAGKPFRFAYFVHGEFMGFKENMMLRLLAGLVALILPLSAMAQDKVLRAVMHADVRVIDPIWTTQTIANIHGALGYDTLFGTTAAQTPPPHIHANAKITPARPTITFTC